MITVKINIHDFDGDIMDVKDVARCVREGMAAYIMELNTALNASYAHAPGLSEGISNLLFIATQLQKGGVVIEHGNAQTTQNPR